MFFLYSSSFRHVHKHIGFASNHVLVIIWSFTLRYWTCLSPHGRFDFEVRTYHPFPLLVLFRTWYFGLPWPSSFSLICIESWRCPVSCKCYHYIPLCSALLYNNSFYIKRLLLQYPRTHFLMLFFTINPTNLFHLWMQVSSCACR